jgi:hypothetical protein
MTTAVTIQYEGKLETFHVEYTLDFGEINVHLVTLNGKRVTLGYLDMVYIKAEISKQIPFDDYVHSCSFSAKNAGVA